MTLDPHQVSLVFPTDPDLGGKNLGTKASLL